jgi:sensor histidine kinase YesM
MISDIVRYKLTYTIIILNIIVYVFSVIYSKSIIDINLEVLVDMGALYGPWTVLGNEWWRLGTAMFLHGGMTHILMNMFSLYLIGRGAEMYFDTKSYIGIYLFLLLIVYIIQKLQRYQTERKIAIEKQISELQLKTIRSQMDPHFTFNALNTISSIIYREDKEKAHRYFTKFSKLVRATLEASEKITRTLNEELDFTENYLMLEKIRFKDKFEYEIKLAENVNKEILIPKMIIQIYVENAIKHGLKHKEKDGLLKIDISQNKTILKIIIEDNGIGRKRAAELETFGTGHGMKIMESIGKLYFKLYKTEIRQKIEDLYDTKGNAAGIRVVVEILKKEELN